MAKILSLFLLILITSSLVIIQSKALSDNSRGDEGKGGDGKKRSEESELPDPVERAIGFTGLMSRWDTVRTWARLVWCKLGPESKYGSSSANTPSGRVSEAATESLKMAEETVEQAAKSAAQVADEAAHAAKKRLEQTMSIHPSRKKDSCNAEL